MFDIVNPRQVVLVSSRHITDVLGKEMEKDTITPVDWHMPVSYEPKMYAISLAKNRFSCELISESNVFVVNFISPSLKDEVGFCGNNFGKHIDKFKETGLTKEEADSVEGVRIKEALAFLECELVNQYEFGDHIVFIGRVTKSLNKKEGKRLFHLVGDKFITTKD